MKTKILVAGLACLSVVAVAQQPSSAQQSSSKTAPATTAPSAAPSSAATTSIGGKKGYDYSKGHNFGMQHDPSPSTVRESPSKGTTAVSVGDVNGDGHADKTASSSSSTSGQNATSNSHASVVAPRDVHTGQSSGKLQYQPVTVTKEADGKLKKK